MKNALVLPALLLPCLLAAAVAAQTPAGLREGDIIFIHSTSQQSSAIEEATASSWTHVGVLVLDGKDWKVAEAGKTVSFTPLADFTARSRGGEYEVKRYVPWEAGPGKKELGRLKKWLKKNEGRKYDIYFEWSDEAMYCSEYVWKAYHYALGGKADIAEPQKFSEMKLSGPKSRELFSRRYTASGRKFDPEGIIVTPAALYASPLLRAVPVK